MSPSLDELQAAYEQHHTTPDDHTDRYIAALRQALEEANTRLGAWMKAAHDAYLERDAARAEVTRIEAENERHRRANLVRAVINGWEKDDDWVNECINANSFDAVPWRITEAVQKERDELRSLLTEMAACDRYDPANVHKQVWISTDLWDRIREHTADA